MKKLIVLILGFALLALLTVNQVVAASSKDTTKPTLNSFSVSDSSITEGDTVKINYSVKDSGGSHLKQVELWKGNSKGNLGRVESKTDKPSAGKDSASGSFTDKPSAGTVYYGIHVVDNAGNVGYDNGAKSVSVKARDTAKPTVSLSVDRDTIAEGDTVTISYKVRDTGGTGLKKVELWKGASKDNLGPKQTDSASGDSKDGKFTDKPSVGTSYYGIHVIDGAGNVGYDNGAKSVTVKARDTKIPTVSLTVDHDTITEGDNVTISYKVRDSGGTGLKKVELWKGASKDNLGPKQTDSASGDAKDGKFTDKPSVGTSYYGIHAIDGAGNVGFDNGAIPVKVVAISSPPNVTEIKVNPTSITAGQASMFKATTDHSAMRAVLRFTDASIDVPMGGSGTSWIANPQISNAGNRPFTVTAYDKNGKSGSSKSGSIQVNKQQDTAKPKVTSLGVSTQTVTLGNSVTISYTVKDDGGSGLKQVELWRGNEKNNLGAIKKETLSGQMSKSGAFTDTPSEVKTYYYGIHVLDKADNVGYDNGAVQVKVNNDTTKPNQSGVMPLDSLYKKIKLDQCDNNPGYGHHRGVDIEVPDNKKVYAMSDGIVVENHKAYKKCDSDKSSCYNKDHWNSCLIILHKVNGKQYYTYYAHITSELNKNDIVKPTSLIGTTNLNHLHLSVNASNVPFWGYKLNDDYESCDSIKSGGWLRFQDVFNLTGYAK